MKEFKGTKGKWVISKEISGCHTTVSSETHRIAEVKHYSMQIDPELLEPSQKKGLANAKLIASAPELLKALQDMYDKFKIQSYSPCQDDALILAEQAINKALS